MIKVPVIHGESYPHYFVEDESGYEGDVVVELTDDEYREFRHARARYREWQKFLARRYKEAMDAKR